MGGALCREHSSLPCDSLAWPFELARAWCLLQVCALIFVGTGSHRNEVLSVDWKAGEEDLLASAGMDDYIMIW